MTTTQPAAPFDSEGPSLFDRIPFYTLVSVTGFALFIVAGLLLGVVGALDGQPGMMPPFVLVMLVAGLFGVILPWRFGGRGYILPVLLAVAAVALLVPIIPRALANPDGGLEFIAIALFLVGALMAVVGGVVSIVQWRWGVAAAGATPGQRRAYQVTMAVAAAIVVLGLAMSSVARARLANEVRAGTMAMQMKGGTYSINPLPAAAGQTVRLAVRNDDATLHTFTLDEAGVNVNIPPGAERLVEFQAPAPGSYTFYCVPHHAVTEKGIEGMVGQLVVAP
jgi:heme/copper-type cytochrome/quinol oxidase subunit 2